MGYFQLEASMNKATVNIHIQVYMWIQVSISLGQTPRREVLGHVLNELLKKVPNCFSGGYTILHSQKEYEFQLLYNFTNIWHH